MKIIYISTPFFADCDFPLIREMQAQGLDVTYLIILTPNSLKSTLFDIKKQYPKNEIIPITIYPEFNIYKKYMNLEKVHIANRTSVGESSLSALYMTLRLYKFIKNGNYDVIHADCMLDMYNLLLYRAFKSKFVLTIHDPFPHTGETGWRKKLKYQIAMGIVQKFVLLNYKQKEKFCKLYRIPQNRIAINKLGVYDNILAFTNESVKEKKNNILFFGRISPYKGVEYLCNAMENIHTQIPDATLTIAGGGNFYFNIEPYKDLPWIDIRNYYITMEELAELVQQCTISVCPYTDATQSGVIMTCYSLCKPVIATNVGGLGEMVEHGKTGFLVPAKDSDALADAIIKMLDSPSNRENMQQYIQDNYFKGEKSWKAIVKKYISFYTRPIK